MGAEGNLVHGKDECVHMTKGLESWVCGGGRSRWVDPPLTLQDDPQMLLFYTFLLTYCVVLFLEDVRGTRVFVTLVQLHVCECRTKPYLVCSPLYLIV